MKKILFLFLMLISIVQAQTPTKINEGGGFHKPVIFQGKLFFLSNDGINGEGLYYTDGVTDDIHFVKTIVGQTSAFTESGSKLFFMADDGSHGNELWVSDGTGSGTGMVKDIAAGLTSSLIADYFYGVSFQGKFYFAANDNIHGNEVWVSDGTPAGTTLFKNLAGGDTSGISAYADPLFTVYENKLYFFGHSGTQYNDELWTTDGTANGTNPVSYFWGGHAGLMVFHDSLWAQVTDDGALINEVTLFDTNGYVADINDNYPNKSVAWTGEGLRNPVIVNDRLLIGVSDTYYDDSASYYLTDGTVTGTMEVLSDISNKLLSEALATNGKLFVVNWSNHNLYASNFASPTELLAPGISNYGSGMVAINGNVCFQRNDNYGMEPWVTNGTSGGTQRLKDLNPGSGNGIPTGSTWNVVPYCGQLYFADDFSQSDFWKTDGTAAGTQRVSLPTDTLYALLDPYNGGAIVFNGCLYFQATTYLTDRVYKYCGCTTGLSNLEEKSVTLYPNPAANKLFVDAGGLQIIGINLYTTTGTVITQMKELPEAGIDVSNLPSGIYIVEIKTKEGSARQRFIKM